MTRALLVALLLSACAPAFADLEDAADWCAQVHHAAKVMMTERQNHGPMPEMLKAAAQMKDERSRVWASAIIFQAFEHDVKLHPVYKEAAAKEFANEQYLKCLKSGGNI